MPHVSLFKGRAMRVGIIGAGSMGQVHAQAWLEDMLKKPELLSALASAKQAAEAKKAAEANKGTDGTAA